MHVFLQSWFGLFWLGAALLVLGIVGGIAWYLWRNPGESSDTFTDIDPAGLGPTPFDLIGAVLRLFGSHGL